MKHKVNDIINDIWRKYPAIHRINLDLDGKTIAIYSNDKELIDRIGYYQCDFVSELKNADFLLSVINVESEFDNTFNDGEVISHNFVDGVIRFDQKTKLSFICSKERFMLLGPIQGNIVAVNEFIESVVEETGFPKS